MKDNIEQLLKLCENQSAAIQKLEEGIRDLRLDFEYKVQVEKELRAKLTELRKKYGELEQQLGDLGQGYQIPGRAFFIAQTIHREDINAVGFDGDSLSDEDMCGMANLVHEAIMNNDYWEILRIVCDEEGLPEKEEHDE
jgi:hypothetical protein